MKKLLYLTPLILLCCSENTQELPAPKLGDTYQGGIVFYILQPGDPSYIEGETHGFIVGKDFEGEYSYGCNPIPWSDQPPLYAIKDKLSLELGMGEYNTKLIAEICSGENVASLTLTKGWYLPNKKEIDKLFFNRLAVEIELTDQLYWTSILGEYDSQKGIPPGAINYSNGQITYESNRYPSKKLRIKPIKRF